MGSPPPPSPKFEEGLKQMKGRGRDGTRVRKRWHKGSETEKA